MQQQSERVPCDKWVLLIDNRDDRRLIRINDNKNFKWRKTPIPLQQIAKHPFFTLLEVANHNLKPLDWQFAEPDAKEENEEEYPLQGQNNKEIFEIEQAQKLNADEIEKMKKEMTGSEIINGLVENNEQFSKRTDYSKEKYLKKKEKKYLFHIHAEPVSLDALHQYYYKQDHKVVGSIRWDTLALLLLYGAPYKQVLLAEQSRGILLGSLLVRGAENITVATPEKKSMRQFSIVDQLNISKETQERVIFSSWTELAVDKQQKYDNFILLGNYNFKELIVEFEQTLKEGCVIAFFCLSLVPLQEAALEMRNRGYLNVRLQDSWSREYQVLQNRTHPLMYMDSCSGYLLTAFKVTP